MKTEMKHKLFALVTFMTCSLIILAYTSQTDWRVSAQTPDAPDVELTDDHDELDDHDGHEHAAAHFGVVTWDEIEAESCEHDVPTVQCDECRYELGVARMDPNLSAPILATTQVSALSVNDQVLQVNGQVQLDLTRVADLTVAGAGRVGQLNRVLGDRVQAHESLAVVQSVEMAQAQSEYLAAKAQLDLAGQTYDREKALHEQQVTSQADWQQAQQTLQAAQASVAAAEKRLSVFGLAVSQDQVFGELHVTSPIAGTVIEQQCVQGQWADPKEPLFRVADLSRVWVFCDVYESDLEALMERAASQKPVSAIVTSKAFSQTVFHGVLDMVGSQLDEHTRTVKCRVSADNAQGKLKPGMFVQVDLGLGHASSVLTVPESAVLTDEDQAFVFVPLAEGFWVRRDVDTGPVRHGHIEILDGLSQGERVVTRGAFMFKSEILKEKMGAGCAH